MGVVEARLRCIDRDGRQRSWDLSRQQSRVTIGRAPEAGVALPGDEEVSRLHAVLEWIDASWTIVDDGLSRNGTFVNGSRISGRRRLSAGDSIRVGTSLLEFQEFGGALDASTRIASNIPTVDSLTETQRKVLAALCRPYKHRAAFANPATNQQIATELYLSVDAIKTHMRALFAKFGVEDLPQNQKRVRLVELAMQAGVVTERDL